MKTIEGGYEGNTIQIKDDKNIRMCIQHFHLSLVEHDSNNELTSVKGASLTVCLKTFSMNNSQFNENTKLERIVGSTEDSQLTCDHELRKNPVFPSKGKL